MSRILTVIFLLASCVAFAQPAVPAFEVASIRAGNQGREVIDVAPGTVTMRSVRLTSCIRWAYEVEDFQISGPGWLNEVWFDVQAKAAGPVPEADLRKMFQTLLTDRFKLAFHRQMKEMPALILTVGKNGHKLQATETEGSPSFKTGKLNLTGTGATIGQLTAFLSKELRNPVIDQTGLTGRFNYFLDINAYITEEMKNNSGPPPEAPSIIAQAVQSQLGLKIDSKKASVEMIEVDHIERTPTEN